MKLIHLKKKKKKINTLTERKCDSRDSVSVSAAAEEDDDDEEISEDPWLYRRHSDRRWTRTRADQVHYLRACGFALPCCSASARCELAHRFRLPQEVAVVMSSVTGRPETLLIAQKRGRAAFIISFCQKLASSFRPECSARCNHHLQSTLWNTSAEDLRYISYLVKSVRSNTIEIPPTYTFPGQKYRIPGCVVVLKEHPVQKSANKAGVINPKTTAAAAKKVQLFFFNICSKSNTSLGFIETFCDVFSISAG